MNKQNFFMLSLITALVVKEEHLNKMANKVMANMANNNNNTAEM